MTISDKELYDGLGTLVVGTIESTDPRLISMLPPMTGNDAALLEVTTAEGVKLTGQPAVDYVNAGCKAYRERPHRAIEP